MEAVAVELGVEAVKFVVEKLIQHVNEQNKLISEAPNLIEDLEKDLTFLNEYLTGNTPKSNNLLQTTLLREVHDLVYKAEDAIDSFVAQVAERESRWFSKSISNSGKANVALHIKSVCEKVKEIRQKVEDQINKTSQNTENEQGFQENEDPRPNQNFAPIFKEEEKILREWLTKEGEQPQVVFVTGTHGIGKTTLAAKMYHDSDNLKFSKRIWVSVSDPKERNILLVVLKKLNVVPDHAKSDWELSEQVADSLEGKDFLIVLENITQFKDWDRLRNAFRKGDRKSKVLITSINDSIARVIVRHDPHVKLNKLSGDESWTLLQWKVFSGPWCPLDLKRNGELIAGNCDGLPKLIAFAGAVVAENDSESDEMSRRQHVWEKLSTSIVSFFNNKGEDDISNILQATYSKLPHHLKACFLYMGIFPQHSKFSVSKLIRLWIAEGFIQPIDGIPLDEVAVNYLKRLGNLNFVQIEETWSDGSPKTCSMNDLWYGFCKTKSGNKRQNFFQEFRKTSEGNFIPQINEAQKNRRVCIHDHISKFIPRFISSKHFQIGLRSFVSHSKEVITLRSQDISNLRAMFQLLRVLDAKPMKLNKFHSDLCQLVHLRFITLSLNGDVLPAAISKLRYIQTLIVHTTSRKLEIKADILKMDELRHFKTNASATLPKKSKAFEKDERLQTLVGISPKSCNQEFFEKTPNLKKLGIHGQLSLLLLDDKSELLRKLVKVKKLKLQVTSPNSEGDLSSLIQPSQLPPSLRSLTLSATRLKWERISILGSLQKLEELKLKNNAFVGDKWEVSGNGFAHLETLYIEGLDFQQWKSSSGQFPQLRRLKLSECKKLREIPIELADIRTFQELQLHKNHISADESAQMIEDRKLKLKKTDSSIVFKLALEF